MMRILVTIAWLLAFGGALHAQTLVAVHAIRARSIISRQDVAFIETNAVGGISHLADVVGKEAKVNLYAGRVIRASEIGPPAILDRNQLVIIVYNSGNLTISSEGRALARAGIGELVRVMNLDSRVTVSGRVMADGSVEVIP